MRVVRYVPRGYILHLKNNFPGRPLTFCGTFKNYVKIDPQQWSYLRARAPKHLRVTPYLVSGVHYGMSVVIALVQSEFLTPFVFGKREYKISSKI